MKTKALRLYGKNDLRLEEFELPEIKDDEILAEIISDSLCMSSYKLAIQGTDHKRAPKDLDTNPIIIGHECCGKLVKVGKKWQDKFKEGDKFAIQPAINLDNFHAPGYSFPYIGGDATYVIIPSIVMEKNCLLPYDNDAYFYGSLAEPMSCIVGSYHAFFHTRAGEYVHDMGTKKGGNIALLASAGPMGLGAIDYAVHAEDHKVVVVTDIDDARLQRAASILTVEDAAKHGVKLYYVNTATVENPVEYLKSLTGGEGFDDVFIFAPVKPVIEMGDAILAYDGCLNFFAGPTDHSFSANFNFYNVHYAATHIIGTSGGNTDDMLESLKLMETKVINPSAMVTHIGGLDCAGEATLNLPNIRGGKKLIYTHISLPLTAIDEFEEKGKTDPLFKKLDEICKNNNYLWCAEAEEYLLANAPKL